MEICTPMSMQDGSQLPEGGSNTKCPSAGEQKTKCGIYIWRNIIQSEKGNSDPCYNLHEP